MIKLNYLIENSLKNLTRTSGIILSILMVTVLSFIAFFFLDAYLFVSHWNEMTVKEAAEAGAVGLFELISPIGLFISFLKISTLIIVICFGVSTLNTIRRLFFQLANDQRSSFQIMSLIGETPEWISLDFSFQSIYVTIFSLISACLSSDLLFHKLLQDSLAIGPFDTIVASFQIDHRIHFLFVLFDSLYVGGRVFLFIKSYLHSYFDNLGNMTV